MRTQGDEVCERLAPSRCGIRGGSLLFLFSIRGPAHPPTSISLRIGQSLFPPKTLSGGRQRLAVPAQ